MILSFEMVCYNSAAEVRVWDGHDVTEDEALKLRRAMKEMLQDWKSDLSAPWQEVLKNTRLDFKAVDASLQHEGWEPIFPTRKGQTIPGEPKGAHIFRALDGIRPDRVKAIVIGQDPYPDIAQATGRAFEQGNLLEWPSSPRAITLSLRRIVQAAAAAQTGNNRYIANDKAWSLVVRDIDNGTVKFGKPNRLFDTWQRQGVLFLNAGLTISRYTYGGSRHQLLGHLPLWRPVLHRILQFLATRESGHVVFIVWGGKAYSIFRSAGIRKLATKTGTWQTRVAIVRKNHPAAMSGFFDLPNVLLEANDVLQAMGGSGVKW